MSRTFSPNFVVAILCVTMCTAYEDDEEQFRDFNDILLHRSRPEKWQRSFLVLVLTIQFLDRENNDKNNTLPLGKQICFTIVWGCVEILPSIVR